MSKPLAETDQSLDHGSTSQTVSDDNTKNNLTLLHAVGTSFVDANGNTVFLRGSHTWNNVQAFTQPQFTFQQYSDFEKSIGANYLRLWDQTGPNSDGTIPDAQLPYQRAADGKFDLTRFNQAFFDNLKADVEYAAQNGQYVSVMLMPAGAWNAAYGDALVTASANVQNAGNGNADDPNIQQYEKAFAAKILDTIGNEPNVIYEITNEANYLGQVSWEQSMVTYAKSYQASHGLLAQMVGITAPGAWSGSSTDINNALEASNADWIAPSGAFFQTAPVSASSLGSKPIIVDTDHTDTNNVTDPSWAWRLLTSGDSLAYMDEMAGSGLTDPVYSGSYSSTDTSREDAVRQGIQETASAISQFDLNGMLAQSNLSSTGYALADAVKGEFVVFAPQGGQFGVDLSGSSGTLNAQWVNIASGSVSTAGQVSGGGYHVFTAPDAADALLLHH
jgi:hypothetical protein